MNLFQDTAQPIPQATRRPIRRCHCWGYIVAMLILIGSWAFAGIQIHGFLHTLTTLAEEICPLPVNSHVSIPCDQPGLWAIYWKGPQHEIRAEHRKIRFEILLNGKTPIPQTALTTDAKFSVDDTDYTPLLEFRVPKNAALHVRPLPESLTGQPPTQLAIGPYWRPSDFISRIVKFVIGIAVGILGTIVAIGLFIILAIKRRYPSPPHGRRGTLPRDDIPPPPIGMGI